MQWQKALYQYQEIPPPHCWEEVRKSISEEPIALASRLFEMEAVPPSVSWDKIKTSISPVSKPESIVVPMKRTWLAYAAAISVLVVLGIATYYVFNGNEQDFRVKDLAAGISLSDSPKNQPETSRNQSQPGISDSVLPATDQSILASNIRESKTAEVDSIVVAASTVLNKPAIRIKPQSPKPASGTRVLYEDGNYIQLVESNGQVIRVSYKLQDMVQNMHGLPEGKQKAEQEKWKKTVAGWKNKLENSAYIPSGSNFFDIAEMVHMIEAENR